VHVFERLREQARLEGKRVAVLFGADWCDTCQRLDLELGNLHPTADIGHVRIFQLKEEDWQAATRMNEFNALRSRWSPVINTYPLFVVLDDDGAKVEEMSEAVDRMQAAGVEPTVRGWFRGLRDL
jgi:thiol-disulfide isomerase/thioredoxin